MKMFDGIKSDKEICNNYEYINECIEKMKYDYKEINLTRVNDDLCIIAWNWQFMPKDRFDRFIDYMKIANDNIYEESIYNKENIVFYKK